MIIFISKWKTIAHQRYKTRYNATDKVAMSYVGRNLVIYWSLINYFLSPTAINFHAFNLLTAFEENAALVYIPLNDY